MNIDLQDLQNISDYRVILVSLLLLLSIVYRYGKDLNVIFSWASSKIFNKSNAKIEALLKEIETLLKENESWRQRLEEIQLYVKSNQATLENHTGILEHPSKVFAESQKITFRFADRLRVSDSHRFPDFLRLLEDRVRMIPFADQNLTLDLTGVESFNSKSLSALHEIFNRIGTNNGIRLTLLFDKSNKEHVRIANNFKKIESDLPTDSAVACLIESKHANNEKPKSKKRRGV
ncbi:hypothetical protein ACQV5J_07940 [Leptospira interrogans]|uniref:hypothetical protein n=1 Tax=Leptospira interrogans TaxID=173 RepID=UPI00034BE5AE|nr:hypothetical protein [Leptospira interrogans]OOB99525.1 hypothetical protein B0192_05250 [Leptospira interrogans serovar Australis]